MNFYVFIRMDWFNGESFGPWNVFLFNIVPFSILDQFIKSKILTSTELLLVDHRISRLSNFNNFDFIWKLIILVCTNLKDLICVYTHSKVVVWSKKATIWLLWIGIGYETELVEHRRDKIVVNKAYMLCYVTMNEQSMHVILK
jgi:hypothetical protein